MIRLILMLALTVGVTQVADSQSLSQLKSAVSTLDKASAMRSANWSISVMDARSGRFLYGHNQHKSLATASTMKAVTTATGLAVLGPGFRFNTYIEHDGQITAEGVLQGNLYIRGEGDPTLGSDRFGKALELNNLMFMWAELVKAAGIRMIRGKIIGDATFFSTQLTPPKWAWEDMGNYYGAGASGLNINENLYRLDFKSPASTGAATTVLRTEPNINGLTFINEVKAGRPGSGDNAYIYGSPYSHTRYVRGTIPPGRAVFSIKGSIPEPALYCAQRMREELIKCGVEVMGNPSTVRIEKSMGMSVSKSRKVIHTHSSPTLREIVYHTNMKSVNLFAEAIANRVAVKLGKEGSTAAAADTIDDYWKKQGVDTRGMYLRDGSGLSSNNVLSTFQLTSILCKAYVSNYSEAFESSLPVAGKSGSLSGMLRGTIAEGRLKAKSGYISGVRAYAGYVRTQAGQMLAFTMISNNFSGSSSQMRREFEKLMVALASAN